MRELVDSDKGKAGDKKAKQNHERIVISLRHVATPDAEERLTRAIGILLKAATKDTPQSSRESKRP